MTPPHRCMGSASKSRAIKVVDSGMCGGGALLKLKNWGPQLQSHGGAPVGGANGRPGPRKLIDCSPMSALKGFIAL